MDKPKGFTLNMGVFVDPATAKLVNNKIEIGVTKKVKIPIFINSDYRLGYVFGAFLACGIANLTSYKKSARGITIFRSKQGYNYDFSVLKKYIKELFDLNSSIREQSLYVYNVPLTRLFKQFGVRRGRHLPKKYHVDNKEFNSGLLDGLEQFHGLSPDIYNDNTYKKRIITPYVKELYEQLKN